MVKIAVVQFHIRQTINNEEADVGANLAKAEKFIAEAKESMVDIIIFPE
jgi:predicted amidohydrolase